MLIFFYFLVEYTYEHAKKEEKNANYLDHHIFGRSFVYDRILIGSYFQNVLKK